MNKKIHPLKIGDECWHSAGFENLLEGTVVDTYIRYDTVHYIIEVKTHVDDYLVIRPWYLTSDSKHRPLFLYR